LFEVGEEETTPEVD
jgi:hypothetical protein